MRGMVWKGLAVCLAIVIAAPASAAVLNGNFCSVANVANPPAGLYSSGPWNDLTGPAGYGAAGIVFGSGGGGVLQFDDGSAVPGSVQIEWDTPNGGAQNTNDYVYRPFPPATLGAHIDDGHDQLMAGYLQASRLSNQLPLITLQGRNVTDAYAGGYSVVLYVDGDDDVENPAGQSQFRAGVWASEADFVNNGWASAQQVVYGRDGGNFSVDHTVAGSLADYARITSMVDGSPTVGNYVQFDGLSSSDFYVRLEGVEGGTAGNLNGGGHGVALNGFAVVPEPGTLALLAISGVALLRRRRRA